MHYYVKEVYESNEYNKTASVKARDDVEIILNRDGWKALTVVRARDDKDKNLARKVSMHFKAKDDWDAALATLQNGDVLLLQFPIRYHTIFFADIIKALKKRNVKTIVLIHDLDMLRYAISEDKKMMKTMRINIEEKTVLEECDHIIVHNPHMLSFLTEMGIQKEKMINLELFDYILEGSAAAHPETGRDGSIIIAGNLDRRKAAYAYHLPDSVHFSLYGIHYEAEKKDNIFYHGAFPPNELPDVMQGSFGLIWDGTSADTCTGVYGEYLKINNPHKTSLYLACGIPVAIWRQAALADFVKQNHCGVLIDSIAELSDLSGKMTDDEYRLMRENCLVLSEKLRNGYYTKKAVHQITESN